MATAIEYQKIMSEIVFINLPGPQEPTAGMTGGDLLHGYLADIERCADPATKEYVQSLCKKWNIQYRSNGGNGNGNGRH